MKTKAALFAILVLMFSAGVKAQVSPIQGLGSIQLLANDGTLATSGCFYFYLAGSSQQQSTFTDSSGQTPNPNPLCLTTGARANGVWLLTSALYKIVACLNNDGPSSCNASDILWSQDSVPGGSSSSGGGGGPPFISGSANPSTTGVLRLSSGDLAPCWRNQANSSNLCWRKDSSDLLAWDGGSLKFPEVGTPTGVAGFDLLWADNTAHRWKVSGNGASPSQLVQSGNDIDTTDAVKDWHFGSTQTPLSSTPPSAGQFISWNGSQIVGTLGPTRIQITSDQTVTGTTMTNIAGMSFAVSANTNYTATCWFWGNAVTGGVAQFQWTGPASPTSIIYSELATAPVATAFGTSESFSGSLTVGLLPVSLALINGANAGTVQLQMSNNTGGDGALLKAGSYCIVQ